jgi:lambda family phage portal protein
MNWLDRAIGYVAPTRAAARVEARNKIARLTQVRNLYEAASASRRTQGWRSVSTAASSEVRAGAGRLRDVSRDLVRNNAYAARAVNVIAHAVVGAGIIPQVKADRPGRVAQIQDIIRRHFDTTDIDADGRLNLYGLQGLAMRTIAESGSVLIRRRIRRTGDGFAIPLQLQVLEPDFLDRSVNGVQTNGNYALDGIEFGLIGQRVAYHLYDQHPGSLTGGGRVRSSSRVSADFVAHVYRVDRPGQVDGVPWFAPVIMRMRDFADYIDAQLMRQKIASCFAAFITQSERFVSGDTGETSATGYPVESFEPGMIEHLQEGESVTFGQPPSVADFQPYTKVTLHEVAAGIGIPYECMTGDLSEVSFISGRLGRIDFRQAIDAWRWNMIIPQMMGPIAKWAIEAASVATGSSEPFRFAWTPPKYEMVDPSSEVPAIRDSIRSGLSSRSEERRKLGYDSEEIDQEILADNARADALGLVFDTDPRLVTTRGVAQKNADPNAPDDMAPASNRK